MNRALVAVVMFSICFGTAGLAAAQPVLERLEQRIRGRIGLPNPADKPDEQPAADAVDAERGYLGVVADDREDRGRGVRVLDVRIGGPGEKAGLRKGDLITGVAGIRVRQMADMADVLDLYPPGDSVIFDILRDAKPQKVKVALGRRGAGPWQPPAAAVPEAPPPDLPADDPSELEQLRRRIEQLERRVAELERALANVQQKQ